MKGGTFSTSSGPRLQRLLRREGLPRKPPVPGGNPVWRAPSGSAILDLRTAQAHVRPHVAWPAEKPLEQPTLPEELSLDGTPENTPDWALPAILKETDKRALDLLFDWTWITPAHLGELLSVRRSWLSEVLGRLSGMGLAVDLDLEGNRRLVPQSDNLERHLIRTVANSTTRNQSMMNRNSPKTSFGYVARRRQGRFRDTSSTVSRRGRSPSDGKSQRNTHLLALGREEENLFPGIRGDGGAVEFFSQRGLKWHRTSSSGDDPSSDGPTRNMASSQVACVNFLLPLAGIPGALAAVLRSIDRDVRTVVKIEHEGNSSEVEFEWIGLDGSLEGTKTRGANATSIDAFLVAETDSGHRRAYLIEWKFVEQYQSTRPSFKGSGTAGVTRRLRYGHLYRGRSSSFDLEIAPRLEDFLYEPFYQIMRQRLLGDRMVERRELHIDEAKVVVVVPELNVDYRRVSDGRKITSPPLVDRFPDLETVESIMRAVLKNPGGQFDMIAPHNLVDAVCREYPAETASWAEYWRERYGV